MRPVLPTLVVAMLASSAASQAPTIRLTSPTASPQADFSDPVSLAELSGDRVLVSDHRENRLTIVDLRTGQSRNIGRQGAGPGEYQFVDWLFPRAGGGAWVVDRAQRRLLPMNADGTFETPIAYPAGFIVRDMDANEVIYADGFVPGVRGAPRPDSMWAIRWDPASRRVDTLFKYDARASTAVRMGGQPVQAYAGGDTWLPVAGGTAIISRADYRFTRQGGPASVSIPWTPMRITDAERTAFEEAMVAARRVAGQSRNTPGAAPSGRTEPIPDVAYPEVMPPFGGGGVVGRYALSAPNGHVWIERLRAARDTLPRYDVIDGRDGRLVGHVQLPANSRLVALQAGGVYITERDADDLAYIRRYAYPTFQGR